MIKQKHLDSLRRVILKLYAAFQGVCLINCKYYVCALNIHQNVG